MAFRRLLQALCRPWSKGKAALAVVLVSVPMAGCDRRAELVSDAASGAVVPCSIRFSDFTEQLGLPSAAGRWPDGTFDLPEIIGCGVALFDYDGDGDLDILQVRCPPPDNPKKRAPNRLFRQQANGHFEDVTELSGLGDPGYGQGVAVGDVDNDGDPDVYFTNYGRDSLYLNNGDGTFRNASAGFDRDLWSTSAAFLDYDSDGNLDLFVVHYVANRPNTLCGREEARKRDYCDPSVYDPVADTLYRNTGNGQFVDATQSAHIEAPLRGLGLVCADLTRDGLVDVYVANDQDPNQLWVNQGDGSFVDEAFTQGLAFNGAGDTEGSMGIGIGDVDGNGRLDLLATHLTGETSTLYCALRDSYADRTARWLGRIDLAYTGFGCALLDCDNDCDLDLAIVNGRVQRKANSGNNGAEFWSAYAQPNLLLEHTDGEQFRDVSSTAWAPRSEVSRGLAVGDLDNDGDPDLVVSNLGGTLRVLRNDAAKGRGHWLSLSVLEGNRHVQGATVKIKLEDRELVRFAGGGYSYLSSCDPRVHVGLGDADRVELIEVRWTDGTTESFGPTTVDREVLVRKGDGR